jgi:hypothetical protein
MPAGGDHPAQGMWQGLLKQRPVHRPRSFAVLGPPEPHPRQPDEPDAGKGGERGCRPQSWRVTRWRTNYANGSSAAIRASSCCAAGSSLAHARQGSRPPHSARARLLEAGPACRPIDKEPVAPLAATADRRCGNGITAPKWSGSGAQGRRSTAMDDDRFDTWTRRRFGRLASLFIAGAPRATDAARCKKPGSTCSRRGKRCCGSLKCDQTVVDGAAGKFCCKREGATCTSGEPCCSGTCDFLVKGGTCAPCRGRSCSADRPCCGGLDCTGGYCDGCRDRAVSCTSSAQCCFSDCTSGACLSALGGRCARDVDCRACYLGHDCANACVDGVCRI